MEQTEKISLIQMLKDLLQQLLFRRHKCKRCNGVYLTKKKCELRSKQKKEVRPFGYVDFKFVRGNDYKWKTQCPYCSHIPMTHFKILKKKDKSNKLKGE